MNEIRNPVISIIIPTLNEEKWIENTLVSIKKQTLKNYEIIVVDSYSKDRTVQIAKNYTKKILFYKQSGPSYAKNFGARVAKGKILVFLDADSIILPSFLSKVVKQFSDKLLVCCGPEIKIQPSIFLVDLLGKIGGITIKFLTYFNRPGFGICVCVRKTQFFEIGGFDIKKKSGEDFDLVYRISKLGKVKVFDSFCLTSSRRFIKYGMFRTVKDLACGLMKFAIFRNAELKNYKFGNF